MDWIPDLQKYEHELLQAKQISSSKRTVAEHTLKLEQCKINDMVRFNLCSVGKVSTFDENDA